MSKRSDLPDELPKNWRWASFGDLAEYVNGYGFSKSEWEDEGRPIIRIQNLTGTGDSFNYYSGEIHEKYVVTPGTLLISWSATLGAYIWRGEEALLNQHIYKVNPHNHVSKKYLYYVADFSDDELMRRAHGSGMKHVTKDVFENFPIPLPSLPEQRRIVAKIEELFSNLNAGMDDLQAAGQQLERYRLSVLQAAVEGRLTADWRRTHDPEPADQLLERILEKRRDLWEKQYRWERYDSKGKKPPSGWKDRYSEPVEPDLEDPPDLPDGWTWTGLNTIYDWSNGDALPQKDREDGPYPVYGGNGVAGHHDEYMVEDEVMVIGRVGANCGNVHLSDPKSWITDNAIYSKLKSPFVDHRFLVLQLRNKRLNQLAGGSGQPYLSQKKLNSVAVALPPLAEQKQVVDEVERLLSVADDTAATAERERTRAERLRQSILKQAFSGRLVPHDEDAAPPDIEASSSSGLDQNSSGDTSSSPNEASSGEDDLMAEESCNGGDPGKQVEMDIEKTPPEGQPKPERQKPNDKEESGSGDSDNGQANLFQLEEDGDSTVELQDSKAGELGNILLKAGEPLTPKELFERSDVDDIDKFYARLKEGVEKGVISESAPDSQTRLLRVKNEA